MFLQPLADLLLLKRFLAKFPDIFMQIGPIPRNLRIRLFTD